MASAHYVRPMYAGGVQTRSLHSLGLYRPQHNLLCGGRTAGGPVKRKSDEDLSVDQATKRARLPEDEAALATSPAATPDQRHSMTSTPDWIDSTGEEGWSTLHEDINYLMGAQMLDQCKSEDDSDVSEPSYGMREFLTQHEEMTVWLDQIAANLNSSTVCECDKYLYQAYREELFACAPRRRLFQECARQLLRQQPQMAAEINRRLEVLKDKWMSIEMRLTKYGTATTSPNEVVKAVESDISSLAGWLGDVESRLNAGDSPRLNSFSARARGQQLQSDEERQQLTESLEDYKSTDSALEAEVLSQQRSVSAVRRVSSQLQLSLQLQQEAEDLEYRYQAARLSALEWVCRVEDRLTGGLLTRQRALEDDISESSPCASQRSFGFTRYQESRSDTRCSSDYEEQSEASYSGTTSSSVADIIPFAADEYETFGAEEMSSGRGASEDSDQADSGTKCSPDHLTLALSDEDCSHFNTKRSLILKQPNMRSMSFHDQSDLTHAREQRESVAYSCDHSCASEEFSAEESPDSLDSTSPAAHTRTTRLRRGDLTRRAFSISESAIVELKQVYTSYSARQQQRKMWRSLTNHASSGDSSEDSRSVSGGCRRRRTRRRGATQSPPCHRATPPQFTSSPISVSAGAPDVVLWEEKTSSPAGTRSPVQAIEQYSEFLRRQTDRVDLSPLSRDSASPRSLYSPPDIADRPERPDGESDSAGKEFPASAENSDVAWDNYQLPVLVVDSDMLEDKADDSFLYQVWNAESCDERLSSALGSPRHCGDSDCGDIYATTRAQATGAESAAEADDLRHVLRESEKQLDLATRWLNSSADNDDNEYSELLTTCETNWRCLELVASHARVAPLPARNQLRAALLAWKHVTQRARDQQRRALIAADSAADLSRLRNKLSALQHHSTTRPTYDSRCALQLDCTRLREVETQLLVVEDELRIHAAAAIASATAKAASEAEATLQAAGAARLASEQRCYAMEEAAGQWHRFDNAVEQLTSSLEATERLGTATADSRVMLSCDEVRLEALNNLLPAFRPLCSPAACLRLHTHLALLRHQLDTLQASSQLITATTGTNTPAAPPSRLWRLLRYAAPLQLFLLTLLLAYCHWRPDSCERCLWRLTPQLNYPAGPPPT